MTQRLGNVFADTAFWVALVVKQDQHHRHAQEWSLRIDGRITTSVPVLFETANTLARPAWRSAGIALLQHVQQRTDVEIVELTTDLRRRAWDLYCSRADKAWSLTDCASFVIMQDAQLSDALTSDADFRQAGFRPVLLEDPSL